MKLKTFFAVILSALMLTSCSSLSKLAGNTDFLNGSTTGSVIANLAGQYLTTGKIDFSNPQTLLNIASLAGSLTSLKGGNAGNDIISNFTQGLVSGSKNLVNQSNSSSVLSGLTSLANMDLGKVSTALQQGNTTLAEYGQVKDQLTNIVSLFKK